MSAAECGIGSGREPNQIRSTHPYGFRSGEWARLRGVVPAPDRDCYLVEFPDGVTDFWVVGDPQEPYEFRHEPEGEPRG